jgi:hypothetical protein
MLGQPEAVIAELLGPDAHVQHALLGVPDLLLAIAPIRGGRGACSRILHLHTGEEEEPGLHGYGTPFERLRVRRQTT